jgi:hypothetical protein
MTWHIHLSPTARLPGDTTTLALSLQGDVITVNGEELDLGPLDPDETLPHSVIDSPFIEKDVQRLADGTLVIHFTFPISPKALEAARFPAPITVTTDGPITLPSPDPEPA